ncbi:MAG: putative bifunctional diguanylate cyclase/phosphodiesterase [Actinomycetales bacterium]
MATVVGRPRAQAAYEAAVALVAAVLLAYLIAVTVRAGLWTQVTPLALGTAVVAALLARFEVIVEGRRQGVSVTFETAALVMLLFLVPIPVALLVWSVLVPFGLCTDWRRWRKNLFNTSLTVICGGVLVAVLSLVGAVDPTEPMTAIGVLLGCFFSSLADIGLSGLHVCLRTGQPLRTMFGPGDLLIGSGVTTGTATIGYLGALLVQSRAPWAVALLLVPVGAVIIASRATRRSLDDQRRLEVLLEGSRERRGTDNAEDILAAAIRRAQELLASPGAELRGTPPVGDELGAPIDLGDHTVVWLISQPKRERGTWSESEQHALDTLAADTAESLARTRLISELSRMARVDGLSGLANRITFSGAVRSAIAAAPTTGYPTLVYLDLNNFKQVNDLHGHHVGDALVQQVAARLSACVPDDGICARLGGDEFAILLPPGCLVEELVQLLVTVMQQDFVIESIVLSVTASIGVAQAEPGIDADRLFRNADLAMYYAKADRQAGPAVYHDGMSLRDEERAELSADLARAVDAGELLLYYQPLRDLQLNRIDGVEALIRWQHPERGLLSADTFIDIAEESGLLRQIGEWVVRQAMADAVTMAEAAGRPLSVAVNVSPRQLGDDNIVDLVAEVIDADTSGTHLVLELTEHAVITEDPIIRDRLERLVETGVSLALDDFGVGYSSVSYLRWLPMQILKLDRSLLRSLPEDERARNLVQALIAMGRALDLLVVAEGVERLNQLECLRELGCPMGQGWGLARPMPLEDLQTLLAQTRTDRVVDLTSRA